MRISINLILTAGLICRLLMGGPHDSATSPSASVERRLLAGGSPLSIDADSRTGYETIEADELSALVSFLASDRLEGRETGSRGLRLAGEYAASLFALWKIRPAGDGQGPERSYRQAVIGNDYRDLGCQIEWQARNRGSDRQRTFREGRDFENYYRDRIPETISAPLVFAGYGIHAPQLGYDDLAGIDLREKILLILDEAPRSDSPGSPFRNPEWRESFGKEFTWMERLQRANSLSIYGPAAVLVARDSLRDGDVYSDRNPDPIDDQRPVIHEPSRLVVRPGTRRGNGSIHISRAMADAILSASGLTVETLRKRIALSGRPASFTVPGTRLTIRTTAASGQPIRCGNVLGLLPGSDAQAGKEAVVVGAHLDHLGRRGDYIFNGADDNASGAAAVLALARALAANPVPPRRSILFCLWTGEEFDRLGSSHFLEHPAVDLAGTVAYLNFDMIGRSETPTGLASRADRLRLEPSALSGIRADNFGTVSFSSGSGFADALERANQAAGIDLLLLPEAEARTSGVVSDYLSFAQAGVPYLYWAGPRHDDYHQTGDSANKLNPEWMARQIRLAYALILDLADRPSREPRAGGR